MTKKGNGGGLMNLTVGKRRGLAACSTERGAFSILALDHRNNLRKAMNPENPEKVSVKVMGDFKSRLIRALAADSSAVLLDPEFGAAQVIQSDSLPGNIGLVISVEATGYTGDPNARNSAILEGWSVGKICRMGASALKLLVYYHPDSKLASQQEDLVLSVSDSCRKFDLPFFLEPLSYSLDSSKPLSSAQKRDVVVRTAKCLSPLGIDVLKAEFPLNIKEEKDEVAWSKACEEISQASKTPWVLLSAGVDFETYLRQLTVACESGASGAMAGRAVWKEAVGLDDKVLDKFLQGEAAQRMLRLTNLCQALGKSWKDFYPVREVPDQWYKEYLDL